MTGRYTEDGIKIDFLNYFDFYEYDEEAGDWDYEHPIPIPLYAGWDPVD